MSKWEEYKDRVYYSPKTELMLDYSGMGLDGKFIEGMKDKIAAATEGMKRLESGAIANPTEKRMVGHYWLRDSSLAPNEEIRAAIENCNASIKSFANDVHSGVIKSESGKLFRHLIVIGIGGSSLGTEFMSGVFKTPNDKMKLYFMDNTDPDGIDSVLYSVENALQETLAVVISKSGGTVETRNGTEETRSFFEKHGLSFPKHAICITSKNSKLYNQATSEGWLKIFPMWDWVGGRTSVMSAVGLLPLALQGIDTTEFLKGAADCDKLGRNEAVSENPALIMALSWYRASGGVGGESMAVLPYKSSLELFAKYLQQLTMESLGKEFDLDGNEAHQGLAVFGFKGSSDQHSYMQQVIAGPSNVFVTLIRILKTRKSGVSPIVGDESTSGDFLDAFMYGTQRALTDHGKKSIIISLPSVTAYNLGQLIALYERTVGMYALLININAYDQPAVEHGKKAAANLITLKNEIVAYLVRNDGYYSASEIAAALGKDEDASDIFNWLLHLAANYEKIKKTGETMDEMKFGI